MITTTENNKKLEYNNTTSVESNVITDDVTLQFSEKNQGKQFFIMLKGLYSNPLGSLIRELISNCFDAYAELGIFDKPVFLNLDKDDGGYYLEFIDNGIGMDSNRIHNVYLKVTESTKENDLNTIGSWGLGSKSPLAYYQEQIYVSTVHNGIKNEFILYIGDNYLPTATFLIKDEKQENAENGTKIKVYIDNNDYYGSLFTEIKQQLAYFDNVIFNYRIPLVNDYKIFENDIYKYRPDVELYGNNLHIVLGKVNYPLDISQLNITYNDLHKSLNSDNKIIFDIPIPLGLKFNIGEIDVTPSREAIRYTNKTKEIIKNKLINLFNYLYDNVNKNNVFNGNIFEYNQLFDNTTKSKSINLGNNNFIEISKNSEFFKLFSYPKFHKFTDFNTLNIKSTFLNSILELEYAKILNEITIYKSNVTSLNWKIRNNFNNLKFKSDYSNVLYINRNGYNNEDTTLSDSFNIVPPTIELKRNISKSKIKNYYLNNSIVIAIPKITTKYNYEKWRIALGIPKKAIGTAIIIKKIKDIIIEELNSLNIRDYNNLDIPVNEIHTYLNSRLSPVKPAAPKISRIKNVEIPVRDMLLNTSRDIKISDYNDENYTGIVVYGGLKDSNLLELVGVKFLAPLLINRITVFGKRLKDRSKVINVFRISETNFKHFEMNRNAIHVKLFNNENNKILLNAAVAKLISSHRYTNVLNTYSVKALSRINNKVKEEVNEVNKFVNEYNYSKTTSEVYDYLMEFLTNNIDKDIIKNHEILVKYNNILNYFTPNLIHYYCNLIANYNMDEDNLINFIDLLRIHNIRIDNQFYLTTIPKISNILNDTRNIIKDTNKNENLCQIKLSDRPFPEQKLLSPYNV